MVAEKGRIPGVTVERVLPFLQALRESDGYRPCPLFTNTVLSSHSLTAIPDICDRLIVAEALSRRCSLITRDGVIRSTGLVATVWE
jgi:PIN domain nuclease of toxin-antitoxin system